MIFYNLNVKRYLDISIPLQAKGSHPLNLKSVQACNTTNKVRCRVLQALQSVLQLSLGTRCYRAFRTAEVLVAKKYSAVDLRDASPQFDLINFVNEFGFRLRKFFPAFLT